MKKEDWILIIIPIGAGLFGIMLILGLGYGFDKKVENISRLCGEINGTIAGVFESNSNKSHYGCIDIPIQEFKEDNKGITFDAHPNAKMIINDCEKHHGKVEVSMNYNMTYNVECTNRVF
jgi:hypothetical protein